MFYFNTQIGIKFFSANMLATGDYINKGVEQNA